MKFVWREQVEDHPVGNGLLDLSGNQLPIRGTVLIGPENLKFKISGPLSQDEKKIALEKSLELASQVEKHQAELLNKSIYNDAFNARIFAYDQQGSAYTEINIAKEVQKKTGKRKEPTANSSDTEQTT